LGYFLEHSRLKVFFLMEKVAKELGSVMKKQKQLELDFKAVTHAREFTRANTLHAVVKLIATNHQVSH